MSKFYITNYNDFPKDYFSPLFNKLEEKGYKFIFADKSFFSKDLKKLSGKISFILSLPILLKRAKKFLGGNTKTVICHSWADKLLFTILSKRKGVDVQWWFFPDKEIDSPWPKKYLKKSLRNIKLVAFTPQDKEKVEKTWEQEAILAPLGIKQADKHHQDSIFGELSRSPKLNFFHKYFTVIVAANLEEPNYVETIICGVPELLKVVKNLQLLIISPQNKYERWEWLSQKMEVEKNVWFLKKPQHFNSWLESGTLFFLGNKNPKINQLHWVLLAMAQGLPIIGFEEQNLKDLVLNDKCALITKSSKENLVQSIIALARDNQYKKELAFNAKHLADGKYNLLNQIEAWGKILN